MLTLYIADAEKDADMKNLSRKEAITLLRNLEDSLDSYCELNEEGKTAFRMAIEALSCSELLNSSDTISRQQAIDARRNYLVEKRCPDDGTLTCRLIENEVINKLPSTQPEQQWIRCSKRMPEEHEWIGTKRFGTTISDEVFVTFEAPDGQRFTDNISFQNGKLGALDAERMRVCYKGAKPIAWIPLPEPYQEGEK